MGKYTKAGRKITDKVWENPQGNAQRVVDALVQAISAHADDMANNYLNGLRVTDTELMRLKLTAWYKKIPQIQTGYMRAMSEIAPAPI